MPNFHAPQWSPVRETWQVSEDQELDNQHQSAINNRNQRMAEVETLANERKSSRGSSAPNSVVSPDSHSILKTMFEFRIDIPGLNTGTSRRRACREEFRNGKQCSIRFLSTRNAYCAWFTSAMGEYQQ
jgi:hypothetical protein